MGKVTTGLESDDPNVRLRALSIIGVCRMLWEDKQYDLVNKKLAVWAEKKQILTSSEISSLREVDWDLNRMSTK
jgi:hypothetical protein